MRSSTGPELYPRVFLRFVFGVLFSLATLVLAQAQTATYRLHRENSTTTNLFQLRTANPDANSLSVQSANLKNASIGEYLIKEFDTQSGVPNVTGTISAGSTISVEVWMRKTASAGTMFPRVKINLNSSAGASLGVITGATQLSTTVTKYTLTGTVPANVSITSTDRFYLWVGVNLTSGSSVNNRGELNIEGTVNGNYDSLMTVPLPAAGPSITNLSPNIGPVGTVVTITGTNFNATQGSSTVTFNGVTATPASWSATSISVPVPSGATTGPVVVTVNSQASNGVSFTVKPNINNLSPTSGPVGTAITITGTSFGAAQGTSTVTFNGTAATPTSWSATSISVPVPSGATTGPVAVSVSGQASNGVTFTVNTTGSVAGTITRASDNGPINGALIEALQDGIVKASSSSAADGSYSVSSVDSGTYDVRVSAIGYQTEMQNGIVVTSGNTTTINKSLIGVATGGITYIHDELARLVGVVTPTEVATYSYDDIGNLLSISRGNASLVSIIEFTPNGGGIGTEVTIFGTAFSTTPSQNSVRFNGVTGTVTSSTTTQLVTTVPVGAMTGPISITTASGTGVSSTPFVVGNLQPTITDFSPASGDAGTSVVINGTNFDPVFQNNKVKFHLADSHVTASTTTSVTTTVSAGATSGKITVLAPEGSVVSADDFFVAPPGHAGSEIAITGRMAIGDVRPLSFTTPGTIALVVFDGVAGQRITLGMSGVTLGNPCCTNVAVASINNPNGTTLFSAGFKQDGLGSSTLTLPVTGTYTVMIDPEVSNVGNATISLTEELVTPISIDGPTVPLTFTKAGQNARLIFSGTAGQRVTVGLNGVTLGSPCCTSVGGLAVFNPDDTALLSSVGFMQDGYGTTTLQLPVTGTYAITVDPALALTGNVTVTLSSEITTAITINGASVPLNFNRVGQNALLTFSGTAGQRVNLGFSGVTLGNPCCTNVAGAAIFNPNGTSLLSSIGFMQDGYGSPTLILPTNGTYAIAVDPVLSHTGNVTVTVSEELASTVTINGSVPLTISRPGQNARVTFDGTSGQVVSLGLSGVTLGSPCCTNVGGATIFNPDGTTLIGPVGFNQSGLGTSNVQLPATGTYAISVDPVLVHTGNVTVAVSENLTGTMVINGSDVVLNFTQPGQNARYTFDGVAGQRVSLGMSSVTIGPAGFGSNVAGVTINKPDGTTLVGPVGFGQNGNGTASQILPVTGTYSIFLDPSVEFTGDVTLTLSEDLSPAISIGGSPVALTFRPGQNAYMTFSGTASQRISLGMSSVTLGPVGFGSNVAGVTINKPDGTVLTGPFGFNQSGNGTSTQVLPVSGTYSIFLDPNISFSGNVTLTLSEDLSPPISIGGSPVLLNFDRPGQNAYMTFSGTAGQRISLGMSSVTLGPVGFGSNVAGVTINKPDGTVLTGPLGFNQNGGATSTQVLPVTGTYAIFLDPNVAFTGNVTLTLSEDVSSAITVNGSAVPLSISRVGQNAVLTFNGTASTQLTVSITGNNIGSITVTLWKPDGTTLTSSGSSSSSFNLATQTLPTTGVYTITIDPSGTSTGSVNVAATSP